MDDVLWACAAVEEPAERDETENQSADIPDKCKKAFEFFFHRRSLALGFIIHMAADCDY